ncbi:type VI secretion system tip protein VgrG [Vibrio harveyi]|nr:type VI secretion system tip protein VgrG [Vibrio harveyi]
MKKASQKNNFIRISSPFGSDTLILNSFEYKETASQLFSLYAHAYFNDQHEELNNIIGKEVLITMDNHPSVSAKPRYFHGVVSRARLTGSRVTTVEHGENYKNIDLYIEPKIRFSDYRTNCRIFQNKSIEEIISLILSEHDVEFSFKTLRSYPKYAYKVQYDETDLAFIERLLSEEGVAYCFSHTESSHVIEFFDDADYYESGEEFFVNHSTGTSEVSHISSWNETQTLTTKKTCKAGFDMLKPLSHPMHQANGKSEYFSVPVSEHYEYLAETETKDDFSLRNKHAIESLQQDAYQCSGEASCRTFTVGKLFKFKKHEDVSRVGKEFVLSSVSMSASVLNQTGQGGTSAQGFKMSFHCVGSKTMLRPKTHIRRPQIRGLQTAIVTGNEDGEIYLDKHGRIKVQFHWDRQGKYDANSSCWIRVAHASAGNGWGSIFHPRVGQEVIVDFVNGDPDQPIVTGSLYNGTQETPYKLPDQASQSGYKSRSVQKEGNNYNELRFEDKPGDEHVYLHAEKLFQMVVEDCADISIENNKKEKVTNELRQEVGKSADLKVGENQSLDVGKALSINAGKSIEIKVGGASIQMSSSGEINIKGNKISINGSAIALKAGQISLN